MENWEKAIQLESFIKGYVPNGWREPIRVCDFVPSITEENYTDFERMMQSDNNEWTCYRIKTYSDCSFNNRPIYRFEKPYVIEAIMKYFGK